MLLGAFLQRNGGRLISVDLDPGHCRFARQATSDFPCVEILQSESVAFLRGFSERIDVLLLDSLDTFAPGAAEHGLAEVRAALPRLQARSLVIFDDTVYRAGAFHGRGARAVPWLLERGWRVTFSGYQTVLGYA